MACTYIFVSDCAFSVSPSTEPVADTLVFLPHLLVLTCWLPLSSSFRKFPSSVTMANEAVSLFGAQWRITSLLRSYFDFGGFLVFATSVADSEALRELAW